MFDDHEGAAVRTDRRQFLTRTAATGAGALVGAGAVVPNDMVVPPRAMALGVPAKIRPDAVPEGAQELAAAVYVDNGRRYCEELRRID